jgi:hypothetical protein
MSSPDGPRVARKGGDLDRLGADVADRLDACIDRFHRRFRRQFGIMLFTSQAVPIAILSLLIIVFYD